METTPLTDQVLLDAARGGDGGALEALLVRHQPRIFRFGMKMCRDREDARDVLQDTLLAAARSLRGFRGQSSLSTWLFTIARSFCLKHRRRSRFAPAEIESLESAVERNDEPAVNPARGPEEEMARREIEAALDEAIRALPPAHREVLLLRDVEGLAAGEVAEVLGVSVATVKTRLHRARIAVRARVAPRLGISLDADREPTKREGRRGGTARRGRSSQGCPDVLTLFSRHLEGEITPDVCARMEAHLSGCARCRGVCESLQRSLALCRTAPTPQVPGPVADAVRAALRGFISEIG